MNWNTSKPFFNNKTNSMNFTLSFENATLGETANILDAVSNALKGNDLARIISKYNVPNMESGLITPSYKAPLATAENEGVLAMRPAIPTAEEIDKAVAAVTATEEPEPKPKTKKAKQPVKEETPVAAEPEQSVTMTHEALKEKAVKLVNADTANRAKIVKLLGDFKTETITKLKASQIAPFNAELDKLFESEQKEQPIEDDLPF